MENASKAIIMAGGILIGVIILSVLVLIFSPIGGIYEEQGVSLSVEQLEQYNRKFNTFAKSLYGSELLSLKNLLEDYNNRILQDADPKYREENEITVIIRLYKYTAEELVDRNGVTKRTKYKKGDMVGEYVLVETEFNKATGKKKQLKDYLDDLQNNVDSTTNASTLLKEFKNMPFACVNNLNTYNSAGRIKSMYFEQVIDENYEVYK